MLDLLIKNGEVVDGSGEKSYRADIGIQNSKVTVIAKEIKKEAKEIIDASGYVVSPGFIDIHGNSDWTLYTNNKGESKIRQGVTTEVQGNCGFTAAPVTKEHYRDLMNFLANTAILSEEEKKNWKWPSQVNFMQEAIAEKGIPFNIAPLVGHGTIKVGTMGFEKRKPTSQEMEKMLALLRNELEQGLFGLSSGLEYQPGFHTDKEELVELCKLVKDYDGVYSTHMRNEGRDVLKSVTESIEVSRESGVSLLITHLKASYRTNWGKSREALQMIDEARDSGIDADFDVYPYVAFGSGLIDLIPPWAKAKGAEHMAEQLKNEEVRQRVIHDMKLEHEDWENPMIGSKWEDVKIAILKTDKNQKYVGKNLAQIAEDMGVSPYDAVIRLLIEEQGGIKTIYFAMCEEDLEIFMKHPRAMLSSDARAVAPYGELSKGKVHPRYYGTYPRILGRYVREKKILSLEEAINKSTYVPAQKMKFKKRGLIKEGYYADITVFDKNEVIDLATFDDPHKYSKGIEYVIVSGKVVISKGEHTGNLPGRILNRKYD